MIEAFSFLFAVNVHIRFFGGLDIVRGYEYSIRASVIVSLAFSGPHLGVCIRTVWGGVFVSKDTWRHRRSKHGDA